MFSFNRLISAKTGAYLARRSSLSDFGSDYTSGQYMCCLDSTSKRTPPSSMKPLCNQVLMLVYRNTLEGCHKTSHYPPQRSCRIIGNYVHQFSHAFISYLIVCFMFNSTLIHLHSFEPTPIPRCSPILPTLLFLIIFSSLGNDCLFLSSILVTCHGHTFLYR